jgi:hypothetical protein
VCEQQNACDEAEYENHQSEQFPNVAVSVLHDGTDGVDHRTNSKSNEKY